MFRSLFKNSSMFTGAFFLLTSAYSHAHYDCETAYQWTPNGSFPARDVVRHKGLAYKAKRASSNEQPGSTKTSDAWEYLGYCIAKQVVHCDFNGDNKLDSAKGFPGADLVGALIPSSNPKIPSGRENEKLVYVGEVTITYDDTFTNTSPNTRAADQIWNQNNLGMFGYALPYAHFGMSLAAGDFNNDNFCDLAIGASGFTSKGTPEKWGEGLVNILYGSSNGLGIVVLGENGRPVNPFDAQRFSQDSPNVPGIAEEGDLFGSSLAAADFNGDGFDDLSIGVPQEGVLVAPQQGQIFQAGYVNIIYGSRIGIQTSNPRPAGHFQHNGSPNTEVERYDWYGTSVAGADFDNDGYGDLVISTPNEDNVGKISLFRGSPTGLDMASKRDFNLHNLVSDPDLIFRKFGERIGVSDSNTDGYSDLDILHIFCERVQECEYRILTVPGSASGLIISD